MTDAEKSPSGFPLPGVCKLHVIVGSPDRLQGDPYTVNLGATQVRRALEEAMARYPAEVGARFHVAVSIDLEGCELPPPPEPQIAGAPQGGVVSPGILPGGPEGPPEEITPIADLPGSQKNPLHVPDSPESHFGDRLSEELRRPSTAAGPSKKKKGKAR